MKKITLFLVATTFAVAVNAQDGKTKTAPATQAATATPVATPAKATEAKNTNTKPHVCTAACKDGKHVYAHGEKGHVCTSACTASAAPAAKPADNAKPADKK